MDTKPFPVLKLHLLSQESVFQNCTVENIIHVSMLSARVRKAINMARIVPKSVSVSREQKYGTLEICVSTGPKLVWTFVKQEDGVPRNADSSGLVATKQVKLKDLSLNWRTDCIDWEAAMATAFMELNQLFNIRNINSCYLHITKEANELHQDPLIHQINRCSQLTLAIHRLDDPNQYSLTWLLNKIHVEKELNVSSRCKGMIRYGMNFSAKEMVFYGRHNWNTISPSHLSVATRLHFMSNVSAEKLNAIIREWKQGGIPNLQLIEHLGDHLPTDDTYMTQLLQGLKDEEWDKAREKTFNMNFFFMAAGLIQTMKSLKFHEGRDIKRAADGMMATVIPCMSRESNNKFIFCVWSGWLNPFFRPTSNNNEYTPVSD